MPKHMYRTIVHGSFVIFFMILLISFPDQALNASVRGLNMWLEVVFPSLLPFFILAELFIAFGVVHFFGTLLEPLMRPIFNVPGTGSFALIIGMASGRSEEHTSELQSRGHLVCRLLLEKKKAIEFNSDVK